MTYQYCRQLPLWLTDKVPSACRLSKERVEDVMEIVHIARRLAHEEFVATTRMYSNINSTLPLKHDCPMLGGAMRLTHRGQQTVVTPFTLTGEIVPVITVGGVTHSMDEGLVTIGTFT
ncbi:MAG: trimethylamine methyltransferase family protein [Alphaproteobacteria bacterium]|nr:trimethylamine methyltransferase family protein [Alphaproteobacteria bacterium]